MKLFVAFAAIVGFASAACPNACSGHGTCNSMDHCNCYGESVDKLAKKLWRGADCSLMTCPRHKSWTKVESGSKYDHRDHAECADGGRCDTSTGECICNPGFEGSACQRTVCPNDCSGHGTCRSNQDFAIDFSEAVYKAQTHFFREDIVVKEKKTSYYEYFLVTYDKAWDAGMQYGCLCDVGFRGVDCSTVECPTSYDAMDKETCEKYSEWEKWGTYASNEKSIFKDGKLDSPSIYGQGNTILIREWHKPERAAATATVPYNPIEEYPCNGAPAGDYCSGRGTCDTSSGICQCFSGFTGPACEEVADIF